MAKREKIEILKDKVRGVISNNKSSRLINQRNFNTSVNIDTEISNIFLEARSTLNNSSYHDYILWVKDSVDFQLRSFPKAYGVLTQEETILKENDKSIIDLVIKTISRKRKIIEKFIYYKKIIVDNIFLNNIEDAFNALDELDNLCGESLWSISLRLTLIQYYFGLEKQKKYLDVIKSKYNYGLIPFLAHRVSLRNEPEVNPNRYKASLQKFFYENRNYVNEDLRLFLTFKLQGDVNVNLKSLVKILNFEVKFNVVDLFNTFSSILRRNLINTDQKYEDFIENKNIFKIKDLIDLDFDKVNLNVIFKDIFSLSDCGNNISFVDEIKLLICKILTFQDNYDRNLERLSVLIELLSFNDNFYYLKGFLEFFEKFNVNALNNFRKYEKYSGNINFVNFLSNEECISDLYSVFFNIEVRDFILVKNNKKMFDNICEVMKHKYNIEYGFNSCNINEVVNYFVNNENKDKLIKFVIDDPFYIVGRLEGYTGNFVQILILLSKYNSIDFSEDLHSEIAAILQNQLDKFGIKYPSDLISLDLGVEVNQLIYFFKNICVEDILDNCDYLTSSILVREERRKVLSNLIKLDKDKSEIYHDDIISITSELKLRSGMEYIDGSRIHVDEGAIRQIILENFIESFKRYENLVKAGIGVSDDFSEVYENFLLKRQGSDKFLELPSNDADNLLLEIVYDIHNLFMFHEKFGLDSFLSKRIRHNSIAGFIRSAPEEFHLVTKKPSNEEDYRSNEHWISKFSSIEVKSQLDLALNKFTKSFDDYVTSIRNDYLQIYSKDNSKGLISSVITTDFIFLLRSIFQVTFDIEEFITGCFNFFWSSLEVSLANVKNTLRNNFSLEISELHDALLADIVKICEIESEFSYREIRDAITASKTKSVAQLQYASEWFIKSRINFKYSFTLDEWVDIAIEAALARHSSAKLNVTKNINDNTEILTTNLFHLADIIQIIVGNISEHVHTPSVPLNISIQLDFDEGIITYLFENPVDTDTVIKGSPILEKIRANISKGNYVDKLTTEGNSGLYKIASIILEGDPKGMIDFQYCNNSFTLKLIQTLRWKN